MGLTERKRRKAELLLGILTASATQLDQAVPVMRSLFGTDEDSGLVGLIEDARCALLLAINQVNNAIDPDGSPT